MIEMSPPQNWPRPYEAIKLHSGATTFPIKGADGTTIYKVVDEPDAADLETRGFRRDRISAHFKSVESDLLRKGLYAQGRHIGIAKHSLLGHTPAGNHNRVEFGSVGSLTHGTIMVSREPDTDGGSLNIHGHQIRMSAIDRDLREALYSTAGAYNRAETDLEQSNQARIVGLLVTEVMRRDARLSEKIREIKSKERKTDATNS